MTELTASCSQKQTQEDAAKRLWGSRNHTLNWHHECFLQEFEPRELRTVLLSYGSRVMYFNFTYPGVRHRFLSPSAVPGDSESNISQNGTAGDVAPRAFVLSQHEESHWHTMCLSSSSTAWGCSAVWLHHQPALTRCLSQSCGLWWTTLVARVYKVTPLNHPPLPMAHKQSKSEHLPSQTLGVMFELPMQLAAPTLSVCVTTNSRAWQHCPGSNPAMRGERKAVRATDALKHLSRAQTPHTACAQQEHSREWPCDLKWSRGDAFKGTAGSARVLEIWAGTTGGRKCSQGRDTGTKGDALLYDHISCAHDHPCPLLQDSKQHYPRKRQNELVFQTRQFKLHCRMFLLFVTSYRCDLWFKQYDNDSVTTTSNLEQPEACCPQNTLLSQ